MGARRRPSRSGPRRRRCCSGCATPCWSPRSCAGPAARHPGRVALGGGVGLRRLGPRAGRVRPGPAHRALPRAAGAPDGRPRWSSRGQRRRRHRRVDGGAGDRCSARRTALGACASRPQLGMGIVYPGGEDPDRLGELTAAYREAGGDRAGGVDPRVLDRSRRRRPRRPRRWRPRTATARRPGPARRRASTARCCQRLAGRDPRARRRPRRAGRASTPSTPASTSPGRPAAAVAEQIERFGREVRAGAGPAAAGGGRVTGGAESVAALPDERALMAEVAARARDGRAAAGRAGRARR